MAAPLNNTNAAKHYLRMALPRLPDRCRHIQRQVDDLRLVLEGSLQSRAREVGPFEAACVAAIAKWQRHGSLAARWLRLRESQLSDADRLRYSETVARAGNEVVRLMALLGLDRSDGESIFDQLYRSPALPAGNGDHGDDTAPATADVPRKAGTPPDAAQAAVAACNEEPHE